MHVCSFFEFCRGGSRSQGRNEVSFDHHNGSPSCDQVSAVTLEFQGVPLMTWFCAHRNHNSSTSPSAHPAPEHLGSDLLRRCSAGTATPRDASAAPAASARRGRACCSSQSRSSRATEAHGESTVHGGEPARGRFAHPEQSSSRPHRQNGLGRSGNKSADLQRVQSDCQVISAIYAQQ